MKKKRVRKWIEFKSKKHINQSNITKKSTYLVPLKREEENVPLKDIVFFSEDQSEEILTSKEKLKLVTQSTIAEKEQNICRCSIECDGQFRVML